MAFVTDVELALRRRSPEIGFAIQSMIASEPTAEGIERLQVVVVRPETELIPLP